jgi:hypothetical protein
VAICLFQLQGSTAAAATASKGSSGTTKAAKAAAAAAAAPIGVRALLLAPTRELAAQIHREVVRLSAGRKLRSCLLSKAQAVSTTATITPIVTAATLLLRLVYCYKDGSRTVIVVVFGVGT